MNVTRKELLAASDVTIVTKRKMAIYAWSNLVCYLLEVGVLAYLGMTGELTAISLLFWQQSSSDSDADTKPTIPLKIYDGFEAIGWLCLLGLQLLFVLRGLPCMKPGPHYVNTCLLKIQFSFCMLCILLTIDVTSLAYLADTQVYIIVIPLLGFILLKLAVHYCIYLKVKYKDDGRELVSFADFFTIQVCFPAMNAWITYQTFFALF